MDISGLQKLSLIDYPGVIASVVFTQGCLFRCPYCHNPDLIEIKKGKLATNEVLEFLSSRVGFLEGVCITGGEPTLQKDLPEFMHSLKQMGFLVKLDTCGILPQMVERIVNENLADYIAMDLKNSWINYAKAVNVKNENAILNCQKTFQLIQESGVAHEFRTTVFPKAHTKDDFFEMAGYLKPGEKYFIQNISYAKTLDKNLDPAQKIDVEKLVLSLREKYPELVIESR